MNGYFSGTTLPVTSQIPNTSHFTNGTTSIRPSVSFMALTRAQAQERDQQVPKNIFNPLTDQGRDIIGSRLTGITRNPASNNRNFLLGGNIWNTQKGK